MKVYVVYFSYDYEGYSRPQIMFSDRKKAISYANKLLKNTTKYYSVSVDEFDMSAEAAMPKTIFNECGKGYKR
jgi:hypothetical protein